jgi:hypothetical protein
VVFSCPAVVLGGIAKDAFCGPCIDIFDKSDTKTAVIGPVLEDEGAALHATFWRDLFEAVQSDA